MHGTLDRTMETSIIDERAKSWDGESDFGEWIRSDLDTSIEQA